MGKVVSLVHVQSEEEIKNSITEALDLISFKVDKNINHVIIKPNLCYYWNASTGYTTDPLVISCIIDWVRDKCGNNTDIKIVETDATAMRASLAFSILGYKKLATEKSVELLNLSDFPNVVKKVKVRNHEIEFKIPEPLQDVDLFINVPKLKLMRVTNITCGMKNLFGCISSPRKIVYHPYLNEAIVGINKILSPDVTIVDGLVALGRHPINLGLLMASTDVFSIDWIASKIMGYNPSNLEFLKIAEREKIGSRKGITTVGDNIEEFKRLFPKQGIISTDHLWSLQLGLLKFYSKIVNDIIPPVVQE